MHRSSKRYDANASFMEPKPVDTTIHKDSLNVIARLSHVALLRAQNQNQEALDIALRLVQEYPLMAKPRIAACLCLLDKGECTRSKYSR